MKLTILSLLFIGIENTSAECNNNPFVVGCYDDPYMAKITCLSGATCTCENYPEEADICSTVDLSSSTTDTDGEQCKMFCENTANCVFYRWDKEGSINSHCLLMDSDQCKGYIPCDREHCLSGQAHCDGDDGGVVPIPDDATCNGAVLFLTDSVHWQCFNLNNIENHINIYIDEDVPTGVICITAQKCEKFDTSPDDLTTDPYYRDLVVQCNPDRLSADVTWGPFAGSDNDVSSVIDTNTHRLSDPKCELDWEDLVLAGKNLHQPGVSFICEKPYTAAEETITISAPNTCALLCNFHPILTIENEIALDGSGVWKKYDTGSNIGTPVVADDIKCWDFIKM